MSEEKKNVNIWKSLQKVPAGTMFVPLISLSFKVNATR